MMKFLIAAAALAVPGAAFAMDAKPASAMQSAGLGIAYTTTLTDDGIVVFQGDEGAGGRRFRLKMFSDGSVAGRVGQAQIRYAVEKQVRDRVVARLRQRAAAGNATGGLAF